MMQFKIDENLPQDVAELLRDAGHDALTVYDQFLNGKMDSQVIEVCRNENRSLVTLDMDFADIRVYPPTQYPGIVVLRPSTQDIPTVLDLVGKFILILATETLVGRLWMVEETKIRVR